MEFFAVRNRSQMAKLVEYLEEIGLPFIFAVQKIRPGRTVEANAYLWGIVYKTIADVTGQSVEEVHEGYRLKYNFGYQFRFNRKTRQYEVVCDERSTTALDTLEFWEYIMKVRADAEIELPIVVPMPQEVFVTDELSFDDNMG